VKIQQAVIYGPRDLRVEEAPLSFESLSDDEVLVRTRVTALSTGTDVGNYLGGSTYIPECPAYPRLVGYSNVGTVECCGSRVTGLSPGQRVFATKRHASAYLGRVTDLILPVPDGVSDELASLAYLAQLGLASLRQAEYQPGESVTIVGLGIVGLCAVAVARALGAKTVGLANAPERLALAERVGAHAAVLSDAPDWKERVTAGCGGESDLAILTANSWQAYKASVEIVRFGGRVCVLGFPGRYEPLPDFNPLDPRWLWRKRLTIYGAGFDLHRDCDPWDRRFTTRRNLAYLLDLMGNGALPVEPLITHRLPARRMQEAYELAASRVKTFVTAVFDWRREGTASE